MITAAELTCASENAGSASAHGTSCDGQQPVSRQLMRHAQARTRKLAGHHHLLRPVETTCYSMDRPVLLLAALAAVACAAAASAHAPQAVLVAVAALVHATGVQQPQQTMPGLLAARMAFRNLNRLYSAGQPLFRLCCIRSGRRSTHSQAWQVSPCHRAGLCTCAARAATAQGSAPPLPAAAGHAREVSWLHEPRLHEPLTFAGWLTGEADLPAEGQL